MWRKGRAEGLFRSLKKGRVVICLIAFASDTSTVLPMLAFVVSATIDLDPSN